MKKLTLTDAEFEAVRLAVAQLAGAAPEGLHLRTALVKFDHSSGGVGLARRSDARRLVEIAIVEPVGTRLVEKLIFTGLLYRWRANHAAIVSGAKWKTSKEGRIVVRIDGHEVDPTTLGENEAFS